MKRNSQSRTALRVLAGLLVWILAVVCLPAGSLPNAAQASERSESFTVTSDFDGMLKRVEYKGVDYVHKTDLTTILFMGVDRDSSKEPVGCQTGGQADFLMLVVLDPETKTIHRLEIDRNTDAKISPVSVFDEPLTPYYGQICLAHAFGATDEERCGHVVEAVEDLLYDEPIDLYVSVNMDKVGTVNDMLGGITVTVEEDMTAWDPALVKGATVTLAGKQAEMYVRGRMYVGDWSNTARMDRQNQFLSEMLKQLRARVKENADFIGELFDAIEDGLCTNMNRGRIINEANKAWKYEVGDIVRFNGTSQTENFRGLTEFFPDPEETAQWVVDTFYNVE